MVDEGIKSLRKKYHYTYIGEDMKELIERVAKLFEEEYNFKPDQIAITNLIAQRVKENNLFR